VWWFSAGVGAAAVAVRLRPSRVKIGDHAGGVPDMLLSPRLTAPARTPSPTKGLAAALGGPRRCSAVLGVLCGPSVVVVLSNARASSVTAVLESYETSPRNLLGCEAAAGVGHHIMVSAVGAEHLPQSGYLRAKLAQERLIEQSVTPSRFFE
jgi:uncharacterized protein YbjT (DUF2867 family)